MVARKVGGELVLVPIHQNVGDLQNIYTMNEVGTRIWEILEEKTTLAEIAKIISVEFQVKEQQATGDIIKFLEQLEKVGAIGSE